MKAQEILWPRDARAAVRVQRALARRVRIAPLDVPQCVAGIDCAEVSPDGGRRAGGSGQRAGGSGRGRRLLAAAVLVERAPDGVRPVEVAVAEAEAPFPYIPGLLAFREAPAVLAALAKISRRPGALLLDGQGLAHPRRFGLACHIGVLTGLPAVGVAKSILVGEVRGGARLGLRPGARRVLLDRGEVVGLAFRTAFGVNPVYLSPGHRVDLPSAARIVRAFSAGYRLPEPTRLAHIAVTAARAGEDPARAVCSAAARSRRRSRRGSTPRRGGSKS